MYNTPERQDYEKRFKSARVNILIVVALTLVNLLFLVLESGTYFLFSAFVPYIIALLAMFLCGKFPTEDYEFLVEDFEPFDTSVLTIALIIAIALTSVYLLLWLLSKKGKPLPLLFALIFFIIDTLMLLIIQDMSPATIVDLAMHIWVIAILYLGTDAAFKLKKMPQDENERADESEEIISDKTPSDNTQTDTETFKDADFNVKYRTFIEDTALGHTILYRRVKNVNELVIDGKVYSRYVAYVEFAHTLEGEIEGHKIEVGFDGKFHSFLKIDGKTVARKIRFY